MNCGFAENKIELLILCFKWSACDKVSRPGDSEVLFSLFVSSCHLLLPVKLLKGRSNFVNALLKDTASELAGLSSH